MFFAGYFVALAISWSIVWGGAVVFAYFDWQGAQREVGVVRPFHWAWAFFVGDGLPDRSHGDRAQGLVARIRPVWGGIAVYVIVSIA